MVKARLLAQPFVHGTDLKDFLAEVAAEEGFTRLRAVVAWAKRSGIRRAESDLRAIRDRGGNLELIVGISEGGATRQGLQDSLQLFDSVHIVHDPSGRTFHPKIYLADGVDHALVLIGSNNLTAGGIYFNYEAGAILELDLADSNDASFFEMLEELIEALLADTQICIELNDQVLSELLSDQRYRIVDEDANRRSPQVDLPEDIDTHVDFDSSESTRQESPFLFGKSQILKKTPVRLSNFMSGDSNTSSQIYSADLQIEPQETMPSPAIDRRWFKKLSNSDAQQKGTSNTNPTGNLKLTQAGLPIDQKLFFRHDFFRICAWSSEGLERGVKEEAVVVFEVAANGRVLGQYPLRIDHADYRVASQGNVPTWLHWGSKLGEYLQSNDHADDYVTLERRTDGHFSLIISSKPEGDFIDPSNIT